MKKEKEKKLVSLANLSGNIFLFLIKVFIGLITGSFALIADSLNSLSDVLSSIITLVAVKVSHKKADECHPFGHQRVESIAGLIIGIIIILIGVELIKESFLKIILGNEIKFGFTAITVLLITIAVKLMLSFYTKKTGEKTKSMALIAMGEDSKTDVLISVTALIGVFGAMNNYNFLDPLMALIISVYIIASGIKIATQNSNQLIGKAPPTELIKKIERKAMEIEGVKGVHEIKAQYLGVVVQVELHVVVNENISIQKAHSIGKNVQYAIESMQEIDRAFIHLDPFKASYFWNNEKLSEKK
jgi:cation diffusion facilitator family transporter